MSDPTRLYEVLREEYVRLHGTPAPDDAGSEAEKLKKLFTAIHSLEKPRSAVCISGGGIRSATFALGVIQRLARVGVLPLFDFLSTVSGGGYIGSWLSSYARRNAKGMTGVAEELTGGPSVTGDPLKPEVDPLRWLRRFSNFLTPRLGLLSGDTWSFAGSYLRNLLLTWLMFLPLLIAALAVPRLSIALLRANFDESIWFGAVAGLGILVGTLVLACTRPVSYKETGRLTNGRFIGWVFLPFLVSSISLVLWWWSVQIRPAEKPPAFTWPKVVIAFVAISSFASLVYMLRFYLAVRKERLGNLRSGSSKGAYVFKKFVAEMLAAGASGAVAAGLLWVTATQLFEDPSRTVKLPTLLDWQSVPDTLSKAPGEFFLCFGVPLVLGILFVQSAIFVGGGSWYNEEYDREWWGRAAGWVLVAALIWIVFTGVTIYGPVAIYEAPRLFGAIGTTTGLFSILGGRSGKTSASEKEEDEKSKGAATAMNLSLAVVGPIFVLAILSLISLGTSAILFRMSDARTISAEEIALASRATRQIELDDTMTRRVGDQNVPAPAKYRSSTFPAIEEDRLKSIQHLWVLDHTKVREGLILVFGFALFGVIVSYFIGVNQFSMHGLYRNRLIRAYLGASRFSRTPNAFSGFDPNDNLPMHRLRPEMLWANSFLDIAALGALLKRDATLSPFVSETTWDAIDAISTAQERNAACLHAGDLLADDLNRAIDTADLDRTNDRLPLPLRNRLKLEELFPGQIRPAEAHKRPMHLVNMALNLVRGDNLAWQERKAGSFAASPIYTGAWDLGFRETRRYGGPSGLSLGTAVAISGAAASPNMGYHSSPALSFLLTLFNVRLGWWLGNPRFDTYEKRNPTNTLWPFLNEATGNTNDTFPYVYLSDGGHFENLGLYEMVLRRCACIVISDGGADPSFGFEDLGNAIRKIRIDFGIDITIDAKGLFPRSKKDPRNPKYCAVGTIHYDRVDAGGKPGRFLYLKPTFYGEAAPKGVTPEPKDIYNYAVTNPTFPHQSTGDQWFSESQFESYRQLGYFSLTEVTRGKDTFADVCKLIDEAEEYLKSDAVKASRVLIAGQVGRAHLKRARPDPITP